MELMRILHNSACTLCVFLNILLIYSIIRKTPRELKSYSILILAGSVLNTVTSCFSFLVFYRIMSAKEYMLAGPCAYSSARFCFVLFSIVLCGHANHCVILVLSSRYSYHQLRYSTVSTQYLLLAILIAMTPGFIIFTGLAASEFMEPEKLSKVFQTIYPKYNADKRGKLIIGSAFTATNNLAWIWIRIVFISTYSIVILSIVQINRLLSALNMKEKVRALHRQVVKGLAVQSALPLIFVLLVYISQKREWIDPLELEFLSITLTAFNITFSAASTIFFIKPYRRLVMWSVVSPFALTSSQSKIALSNELKYDAN